MSLSSIAKAALSWIAPAHFRASFFANEAAGDTAESVQYFELEAANALNPDSEWTLLAPYGDWPHPRGTQRFSKSDADLIVANSFKGIGVKMRGIPFYIGHPDNDAFRGQPGHTDSRAYGRIKKLESRSEGLFANIKWGSEGRQMIEDGAYHGHSVNWGMVKDGSVYRPVFLKSVGFTNNPNIPCPPILHANEKHFMNKELLKLLGLPETATEAEFNARVTQVANELSTAQASLAALKLKETEWANEKTTLSGQVTTITGERDTLKGQVTTLTTERDAARTSFANERKERSKALLDLAIREGKITKADRTTLETEFANESTFEAALTKLNGKTGLPVKDKSEVDGRRTRVADSRARMAKVHEFVNAKMATGMDYNSAFAAARVEKPELFANMIEPGQGEE